MKTPAYLLLASLAAAIATGCGPQSSHPLVTVPAAKPRVETPAPAKIEESTLTEKIERAPDFGQVAPASAELPAEPASAVAAKPPTEPEPAAARPKADRQPTKPGDPDKITFDDLILGMQPDMVYRPFMLTDRVKELDGKKVRLTGDMLSHDSLKVDKFVILRNKQCKYGAGGQADHVAMVYMKKGHKMKYTDKTVYMEGVLKVAPEKGEDGNTWHVYVLEDAEAK